MAMTRAALALALAFAAALPGCAALPGYMAGWGEGCPLRGMLVCGWLMGVVP